MSERQAVRRSIISLEPMENRALLASIAFFADTTIVDINSSGTSGAAANLFAELTQLGHTVTRFTGTDEASIRAALAGADLLMVPDQSRNTLNGKFSNTTKQVIRDYVSNGGGFISLGNFSGRSTTLLNSIFQYPTLRPSGNYGTYLVTQDTPFESQNAVGTSFASGPSFVRDTGGSYVIADLTQSVSNARSVYADQSQEGHSNGSKLSVVAVLPYASRFPVVFLGRDWASGGPNGTEDYHWSEVLDRAVDQVAKSPASTKPTSPGNLTATQAGTTQINLTWEDRSTNESRFQLERSNAANGTFSLVRTAAMNATSIADTGLSANTTYYYRLRAVNAAGTSTYTSVVSAKTAQPTTAVVVTAALTSSGSLYVEGTDADNRIRLYLDGSKTKVSSGSSNVGTFSTSKIKRIFVRAKGGNDTVLISAHVRGAEIKGHAGNDTLIGGNKNDSIYGGDGNDFIIGGFGKDKIDGGAGNDLIYAADGNIDVITGGAGTDTLIGDASDESTMIELLA